MPLLLLPTKSFPDLAYTDHAAFRNNQSGNIRRNAGRRSEIRLFLSKHWLGNSKKSEDPCQESQKPTGDRNTRVVGKLTHESPPRNEQDSNAETLTVEVLPVELLPIYLDVLLVKKVPGKIRNLQKIPRLTGCPFASIHSNTRRKGGIIVPPRLAELLIRTATPSWGPRASLGGPAKRRPASLPQVEPEEQEPASTGRKRKRPKAATAGLAPSEMLSGNPEKFRCLPEGSPCPGPA